MIKIRFYLFRLWIVGKGKDFLDTTTWQKSSVLSNVFSSTLLLAVFFLFKWNIPNPKPSLEQIEKITFIRDVFFPEPNESIAYISLVLLFIPCVWFFSRIKFPRVPGIQFWGQPYSSPLIFILHPQSILMDSIFPGIISWSRSFS